MPSSLCIASGLPTTTALRRVDGLIESGLIQRAPDPVDHRLTLLQIAAGTVLGYALYAVLGVSVGALVRSQVAAVLCALFTLRRLGSG